MAQTIPATMRAAQLLRYGLEKSNFAVNEVAVPEVKDNEVLIKVYAASVNPVDYKIARGDMQVVTGAKFPAPLGFDVSGVVVKTGAKCTRIKANDAVFADVGLQRGTYAEYVAVAENHVALKPSNLDWGAAAATPLAALTALQGLRNYGKLQAGQKLLVLGGSGGVGSFAVQFGKQLGAYVATTSSQAELVRDLGADEVINYREQDVGEVLKGQDYDLVLDCVGGEEYWKAAQKLLKKGGHYVTLVGDSPDSAVSIGALAGQAVSIITRKLWSMMGSQPKYTIFFTDAGAWKDLDDIREYMEQGKVRPLLDPSPPFTLDTVHDMFEKIKTHRVKGKLVLKVLDDGEKGSE